MIEIENLAKVYPGNKLALHSLDLQIGPGVFGLLGPNGAGKTTLMRILATLLRPTRGRVRVYGHDLDTPAGRAGARKILGYLAQEAGFHLQLTVEQELDYLAILKGVTDPSARVHEVDTALERVGLEQARGQRVKTLSGGMKRRLGIAIALLGNPRLIVVDEPTAGLDPAERVRFCNLLLELAQERTVVLSTHIVQDVSTICHDLAVIHEGSILFHGPPAGAIRQVEGKVWIVPAGEISLVQPTAVVSSSPGEGQTTYRVFSPGPPTPRAGPASPSLEDAYLWFVRREGAGKSG
jgi:ABC-2 type transport system ATP-binding protein